MVSERIRKFLGKRIEIINKAADKQDKFREQQVEVLDHEREAIEKTKAEDEGEIQAMHARIEEEKGDKGKRDQEERERLQEIERKR
jgi:ABC-type phosphate transport system auxiliary subunit